MRNSASYFLVVVLAMQASVICAQAPQKSEPQFTLTISEYHGEFGPGLDRLNVVMTNTSNEKIIMPGCEETRGYFTVTVLYNGVPLVEKDEAARRRTETEEAQNCTFGPIGGGIKPGKLREYWVSIRVKYDVSRPGTYEVTVSRETDPDHPEKSVTVKSNTLTVVVPEPAADATQ
jgi:hypothetical protein